MNQKNMSEFEQLRKEEQRLMNRLYEVRRRLRELTNENIPCHIFTIDYKNFQPPLYIIQENEGEHGGNIEDIAAQVEEDEDMGHECL